MGVKNFSELSTEIAIYLDAIAPSLREVLRVGTLWDLAVVVDS